MSARWFRIQSIGTVQRDGTTDPDAFLDPAQPSVLRIDARWQDGLAGIDEFSHLVVLFWLDRAQRRRTAGRPMHPDGRDEISPVGFFATRTPKRPNPIGIACLRLIRREGRDLHVSGIDAWDGTPIIDIKGYYPRDELRPDAQVPQWLTDLWRTHDEERTRPAGDAFHRVIPTDRGNIILREPTLADVDGARRFINELSSELTYIMFQGEQVDEGMERAYIIRRMEQRQTRSGVTLFAMAGDEVAGSALIDLGMLASRHVGEFSISIAEQWRGLGLGRALMEATIDHAHAALPELRLLRLDVFANNQRAQALYRSLGFRECGRMPGAVRFRGEYIDLIQMVRPLTTD